MFLLIRSKRGQEIIGMSVGTIISIIIIISIISIGIYIIVQFLDINKCVNLGYFYEDLQDEIDKAWTSPQYSKIYEKTLADIGIIKSNAEKICFGNLTSRSSGSDGNIQLKMEDEGYDEKANVFFYPGENICEGFASKKLGHVRIDDFFCINVKEQNSLIKIKIIKEIRDNLARIEKI